MSDEVCLQVVDLYLSERKRGAAGGNLSSQCVRAAWETSFQWKAERVMAEENCFKVRAVGVFRAGVQLVQDPHCLSSSLSIICPTACT